MTLSQSAVSELLDAFRAGDGVNLIRDAVQLVLQEMIETEALEHIADRYEPCEDRLTERNGHRPRLLATQAGDVELRIPKLLWLFIDDPRAPAPHVEAVRWEDGGPLCPDDDAAVLTAAGHPDAVHVPTVEVGTGRFH